MAHTFLTVLLQSLAFFLLVDAQTPIEPQLNRYITRPELIAPRWNITIHDASKVNPGYWFVAPYEHIGQTQPGGGWIGPHIYDINGELIWSGAAMFGNMSVMDFRISKLHGENVMSLIRPELRSGVFLDNSFRVIKDIPIEGFNMHDLNLVDNGERALIITRGVRNASEALSRLTGLEEGQCEANFLGIQEVDAQTWQPVWNWTSYGRIGMEETTFKYGPAKDRCKHEWDFLHANAVDKCDDGDILMSGRHTDTIYKISKNDGSIVWRLGGLKNDFKLGNVNFSRQHDVRCRSQNETHTIISFLDNAKGEDPKKPTSDHSRGLLVALDHINLEASLVATYDHPHGPGGYTFRRGSFQVQENDHVFMGWSEHSLQTEHTPDGQTLMEAELIPHWLGTYRSYKFPFVGRPVDPPDVVSYAFNLPEDVNRTVTEVFVSWNGATEVAAWNLYKSAEPHKGAATELLATVNKTGFETLIAYNGYAKYIFVEAIDRDGAPLGYGRSTMLTTIPPWNILTPQVAAEELWIQQAKQTVDVPSPTTVVTATPILSFIGGFILCALLSVLACIIWWTGLSFRAVRTPWHRQAQHYQPLEEKNYAHLEETELESPV